jgi:hypothetical protein
LLKEKQAKEEQMLLVKNTYKDLQSEVVGQRELIKKLQDKYKNHDRELKDLDSEHLAEKQDFINELRNQRDDLNFFKKVFNFVFKAEEIARIRTKSTFDENSEEWTVPPFIFK